MIVVVMQRLRLPPLHAAIFEEDEVQAFGMVITPFTAGVRGIGENGMVPPTAIGIGLQHAGRVAVAERVAVVAPHRPHELLELRRAHRGLEFLERRHTETTLPGKLRIRRQHRAVVGHEPVLRDERRCVEPGP